MRARLVLSAAAAAGVLLAANAGAAPAPQITDAKGDAVGGQAAYDIVSVTFETTKASKAKTAPIKEFIVTMELAGNADFKPGTSYTVEANDTPCGGLIMYAYWGVQAQGPRIGGFFGECGPDTGTTNAAYLEPRLNISGNKVQYIVSAGLIPKEVRGANFTGLNANTAPAEPVVGLSTVLLAGDAGVPEEPMAFDFATSDKQYKFGS